MEELKVNSLSLPLEMLSNYKDFFDGSNEQ